MSNINPYDASRNAIDPRAMRVDESAQLLSAPDVKKAEAIIKDANQFWLAILASLFCSLFGVVLIVPWYSIRFIQYRSLAAKYPILLTPNPLLNSLADRFQKSQWKLLTAVVFGCFIFMFYAAILFISLILTPAELSR